MNFPSFPNRETGAPAGTSGRQPGPLGSNSWILARLIGSEADGLCMVSEVTPLGARVVCALELRVDEPVTLDLGEAGRIAAHVRWMATGAARIEFETPLIPAILPNSGFVPDQRRTHPRFRRCTDIKLDRQGRELAVTLANISSTGICVTAPAQPWLREGAEVVVTIKGFEPAEASVHWIDNGRIGLEFIAPLRLWRLDNWLKTWAGKCTTCQSVACIPDRAGSVKGESRYPL